jgi:hypothetical protein
MRILLILGLGLVLSGGSFPARAAVVISEFLAENDGGLKDQNGDTPDWIELFNNSLVTMNLAGWHLTDTPTNLTKWAFPATNVPSGSFLLVFASGKDRATNGAELHTNFQIDNSGGYLALVDSNGVVVSAFNYPAQHRNVSFGPGASNEPPVTLLSNTAAAQWFVPTSGLLGISWTAPTFDASTWNLTVAPLRYDLSPGNTTGLPVLSIDINDRENDNASSTQTGFSSFIIGNVGGIAAIQNGAISRNYGAYSVTLSNSSASFGYDDRLRGTPVNNSTFTESLLLRDVVFSRDLSGASGLDIALNGLSANQPYDLTVWSFDALSSGTRVSDWFANGEAVTNNYTFNGSAAPISDSQYRFTFRATASASGLVLISGRRDPASVDGGNAASFGVFLNALQVAPFNILPTTNGNLAAMVGQNSSILIRQPFTVANPASVNQLTLRVKYNDGFVAYLNGSEVARRNAPLVVDWNSTATATHSSATSQDILLPGAEDLLVSGTNILAVQGLNISSNDGDFYLEPHLIGTLSMISSNRFFSPSTPGLINGLGYMGVVADTKFSVNRGFYDTPFSLSITTATAGASVYFTTNGSAPSPVNGFQHSSPINITGNSFIRAQAFLSGWIPSGIDTHSYIFLRDVLRQSNNIPNYPTVWQASYPADYAMDSNIVQHVVYGTTISNDLRTIATLALVTDQNGLWHSSTGIYPNATSTGAAWERAASLELIRGDGQTEFATTAKIQMHGNASRDNARTPKHSIRANFSSDFGPTRLDYNWFGGGVQEHDAIVLRSCGFVDGWAGRYADNNLYISSETGEQFRGLRYRPETTCYLRDVWVKESFREMGWLSSRSTFVHFYLNGLYWGLYQPSERYGSSYFQKHLGGEEGAWDVVVGEDNNGPPVLVDGSLTDWNNVLALANAGVASESAYAAITNLLEIDNLIDYMLLHIVAESEDWPRHNWYVAHRRATNGMAGTKFVCAVWDQELTLDRLVRRDRINVGGSAGEVYSPARVYQQLRAWPEFVRQFGDRVHKHLFNGGTLTPSNNVARLLEPAAVIRDALVGESARWGDARKTGVPAGQIGTGVTFTRDEWWQPEIDKQTTNFFQHLTADNIVRLRAAGLYPQLNAPVFSQFGGAVSNGFALTITHTNISGTIYFTTDGTDPRAYGSGAVAAGAQAFALPVAINAPTVVRARVLNGSSWSALVEAVFYPPQDFSKLALTELMYNPPVVGAIDGDEFEFIELKNAGTNTLNLSGLNFSGLAFTFTNGTTLAPGEFIVLVRNALTFAFKYPDVTIHGTYTGGLNNSGENITLSHALGGTIFSVTYDDAAPWPVTPDGFGFSLVPVNPGLTQAPDDGAKWRASTAVGGSPGTDDPAPAIAPVVINEALTHTDLPFVDRIELFNPTGTNVGVGGWFLTDDPNEPQKFRIADGTIILAGGYLSFDELQFNSTPGTNGSFSLSSSGEQVYLFSGDAATNLTGYSHGFNFGAAANGVTFGRYLNSVNEEQFPAQIVNTFNNVNSGPRVGPIVINEIHYNPVMAGNAFVELKNISAANVPLFDPAHPENNWKVEGLDFTFPSNLTVPPNGFVLIVASNVGGFIANHNVPANVPVFTYESLGSLQNSGERVSLTRPDAPDTNGTPYIVVDSVRYNDKLPWPPAADGSGPSLQRKLSNQYGDDPINWQAAMPTPGRENAEADTDGDGMPDSWETTNGTLVNTPDANDDVDTDGFTNYQEYLAGTNPLDSESRLRVQNVNTFGGAVEFQFTAASNRTFTVQFKDALDAPLWSLLTNIAAAPQTRVINVNVAPTNNARFYRLAVP